MGPGVENRADNGDFAALVEGPLPPKVRLSPDGEWLLFCDQPGYLPLACLAEPELRLAGIRFHAASNVLSRQWYSTNLRLMRIADRQEVRIDGLPPGSRIQYEQWSPDSRWIAVTASDDRGMKLWAVEVRTGKARCLAGIRLNDLLGIPVRWLPDSQGLLCKLVPDGREGSPPIPDAFCALVVRESTGQVIPPRNHPDMLAGLHDEALFEYYGTSRLALVTLSGSVTPLGPAGLYAKTIPSPDGAFILVEEIHRPFSHIVPFYRFPIRLGIWDLAGRPVREVADLPLAEQIPIVFGAVRPGPRQVNWRGDAPATLFWAEAQDGGDPRREAQPRDHVYQLSAPFVGPPKQLVALSTRFREAAWGNERLALVTEQWKRSPESTTWLVDPGCPDSEPRLLWGKTDGGARSYGTAVLRWNERGRPVLHLTEDGRGFYCVGDGLSPEDHGWCLYRLDATSLQAERVWRPDEPHLDAFQEILDEQATRLLTWRHSSCNPGNYFLHDLVRGEVTQLTHFVHSTPKFLEVQTRTLRYRRADGLELATALHLPLGYDPSQGRVPALLWVYAHEHKEMPAGQQSEAWDFVGVQPMALSVTATSPLVWLSQGYAVLSTPPMPIVGDAERPPNDTFAEQLVANAKALVEALDRDGVVDTGRMAVGGHSFGASTAACLLAYTDLFRAGICWSGAYNRTLTAYGFQSEERTLWEAPAAYLAMSPFLHVDRIRAAVLLIHGAADENTGTTPEQSVRFFDALQARGVIARLVLLPHEGHSYQARESILCVLREMKDWLDRHVMRRQADLPT